MTRKHVSIAIVGTGFIAETRARAYAGISGYDVRLAAVVSRTREHAEGFAQRHAIPSASTEIGDVLRRPDIDVVDLCVPNYLHRSMAEAAAAAGKHVICPKPLTAFDGGAIADGGNVSDVPRAQMLQTATDNAVAMVQAAGRSGVLLMYAENWVYAPSITKANRLAKAGGGTILEMRGGECHSGSHSPYSKEWKYTGGGALLRLGVHPLGAMLYLKRQEGIRRWGRPIRPSSVVAEVGDLTRTAGFEAEAHHWIGTGWRDVENWGSILLTFDDHTRGIVWASDAVLGGMESSLKILMSNAHINCNLSHTRLVEAYAPDPSIFDSEYLTEKLETSAGWSPPQPDEDWVQGHRHMLQDFVASVVDGHPPQSDGELGCDVVRVVYGAYVSAQEGRRVTLGDPPN
jgi:predicted dehydrogenase